MTVHRLSLAGGGCCRPKPFPSFGILMSRWQPFEVTVLFGKQLKTKKQNTVCSLTAFLLGRTCHAISTLHLIPLSCPLLVWSKVVCSLLVCCLCRSVASRRADAVHHGEPSWGSSLSRARRLATSLLSYRVLPMGLPEMGLMRLPARCFWMELRS